MWKDKDELNIAETEERGDCEMKNMREEEGIGEKHNHLRDEHEIGETEECKPAWKERCTSTKAGNREEGEDYDGGKLRDDEEGEALREPRDIWRGVKQQDINEANINETPCRDDGLPIF